MSFSTDVKIELCAVEILSPCCLHAQTYGLCLFGRLFSAQDFLFSTESETLTQQYLKLLQQQFSVPLRVEKTGLRKYSVMTDGPQFKEQLLEVFGHTPKEPTLTVNRANFSNDCCYHAFIRGAFLVCGTVSSPEKNYHLEFTVPYKRLSADLLKLMEEVALSPKYINRKGNHVVYFKDSGEIEDVLTVMGATNASLELMGIKIHKDMRNKVNRKLNFETANIDRTVGAAMEQLEAIAYIEAHGGIQTLPEPLREVALVRRENPEVSLRELAGMLEMPLSRSGVNHRLQKIVAVAKEMQGE